MITQKQYIRLLETMNDADWKDIRKRMAERLPETQDWPDDLFKSYCAAVVRSGFRKEGFN